MTQKPDQVQFKNVVILVDNVNRSKSFYTNLLDQKIENDFGRNVSFKGGLSIWKKDYALEHINSSITDRKLKMCSSTQKTHAQELYFEAKNIDEFQEKIIRSGTKMAHEIITQPWQQKAFRFFDPDGFIIEVAESMESVVKRLAKRGLSVDEINEKCMMPNKAIKRILRNKK